MNRRIRNRLGFVSAGIASIIGSAAALSRSKDAIRTLPVNHLGGRQQRIRAFDRELFVTELGSGPPIVLVHGVYAGASSYEFRNLAPLLAASHRVIAFDFLGCGLSDHPSMTYTAATFVEQILQVVADLTSEPVVLIGSSYGAVYTIAAAAKAGEQVRAVVALSPAGIARTEGPLPAWRRIGNAVLRTPLIGDGAYAALVTDGSVRSYLRRVYNDTRMITPDLLAHFKAVTHTGGAKPVVAAFVGGALDCDLTSELPFLETPILTIRGNGTRIGSDESDTIAALGNNVQRVTLERCGALPHEERPQETMQEILRFLERTPQTLLT